MSTYIHHIVLVAIMAKKAVEVDAIGLPINIFGPDAGTVLGEGPMPCTYMFIGEAPGYGEDVAGRPFIGVSGKFLNYLLAQFTELRREGVYVTNVVKHRPTNEQGDNRVPIIGERKPYLPYLYDEIRRVNPDVIVALGGVALWVFDGKLKVTTEHGRARLATIPNVWEGVLVPWLHPAYALRSTDAKIQALVDAKRLHEEVVRLGAPSTTPQYNLAEEDEVVSALLRNWCSFGFDTETTSPRRGKVFQTDEAEMVGYSVSTTPYSGVYVPSMQVGAGLAGILASPLWTKICHNFKFEYKVLRKQGVEINGFEDTALAAWLLGEPRVGLKVLSRQLLGVQPTLIKELWPEGIANQPKDVAFQRYKDNFEYGAADPDNTARLWPGLSKRLDDEGLRDVYEKIEKPLVKVLARMEGRGMGVDVERCKEVAAALGEPRQIAKAEVLTCVEDTFDFNIDAPDDIAALLTKLGAPLKKRTPVTKRFVVDAEALRGIRDWWPEFIDPLLDYRKYTKLVGYTSGFITLAGADGRLHTSFNQASHSEEDGSDPLSAPSTGRLSSSGPNLANIPHHRARVGEVDWGVEIRSCLVAAPGKVLMSIDLAQEEPRIIAVLANDETLLQGFRDGRDIYRPATESLYDRVQNDGSDVDFRLAFDYERFVGKTFFLAWYYGAGASRLTSLDKELTSEVAKAALGALSLAHPARDVYLDYIRGELYDKAVIESMHGRKRWIRKAWTKRNIRKGDRWPRGEDWEAAVREGANMRIQATAADFLKMAMYQIDTALEQRGMAARLVSTVYDEVVLELPLAEVQRVYDIVRDTFAPMLPGLPLEVEAKVGTDWGHLEGI